MGVPGIVGMGGRALALVDGEHYPAVTKDALEDMRNDFDLVGALFLGGSEKVAELDKLAELWGCPVYYEKDQPGLPFALLRTTLAELQVDAVMDLSDEPIVTYPGRMRLASLALAAGARYLGAGFSFEPPRFPHRLNKPALAVFGTAKRVGKTAVTGYIARLLADHCYDPLIITMGRGGPATPEVVEGRTLELCPEYLLAQSEQGKHACSDHWEDAYTARVTTIGCRRCAGGIAGEVLLSNMGVGVEMANARSEAFVLLEGSGASLPPVQASHRVILIPASQDLTALSGYFGPYKLGMADLAIVTGCEPEAVNEADCNRLLDAIRSVAPELPVALTRLRPRPLGSLSGKRIFLVCTAPSACIKASMIPYLEENYACKIIGFSPNLSKRGPLAADMKQAAAAAADLILTEIKAAGVDVVVKAAVEAGQETVFMDHEPEICTFRGADENQIIDLEGALLQLADAARSTFAA